MYTFALFMGLWLTTCIQTQIDGKQGYVTEAYSIESMGQYQFTRTWYEDINCTQQTEVEEEYGQITLGNRLQGIFMADKTVEANFYSTEGLDYGALGLTTENKLRVSRGTKGSTFRNTMLSLFEFTKQSEDQENY